MSDTEAEGSYRASEMNTNVEAEMERLRKQALWGWDKELRNLQWFGLSDGMSLLEIGSGPGFITEQLLAALPHLQVTGLEIDPEMVSRASKYLEGKHGGRGRFVQGSVMEIDFPDGTFDYAYARLVFQHLPDPLGAMREIRRVLKPGGKLVVYDIDDDLNLLIEPSSPESDVIIARMQARQATLGGSRFIGRRLWRLMAEAGFTGMDLEMAAVHTDEMGVAELIPEEWDQGYWDAMVQNGSVTPDDVEVMRREHEKMQASPDKYALFVTWMVCGTRGA